MENRQDPLADSDGQIRLPNLASCWENETTDGDSCNASRDIGAIVH